MLSIPGAGRFSAGLLLSGLCLITFPMATQALLPNSGFLPRIADTRLDDALARTAQGIIRHNVDPYADGLVHRPNSEEPGDAVSEAQAYGMIVTL